MKVDSQFHPACRSRWGEFECLEENHIYKLKLDSYPFSLQLWGCPCKIPYVRPLIIRGQGLQTCGPNESLRSNFSGGDTFSSTGTVVGFCL